MVNAHPVRIIEWFAQKTPTGRIAAAARDPAETRFENQAIKTKTANDIASPTGERTAIHPAAVATPLPPVLNFRYKGKR